MSLLFPNAEGTPKPVLSFLSLWQQICGMSACQSSGHIGCRDHGKVLPKGILSHGLWRSLSLRIPQKCFFFSKAGGYKITSDTLRTKNMAVQTGPFLEDSQIHFLLFASLKATFADFFSDFPVSRQSPISERPKPRLAGRHLARWCVDPHIFKPNVDFEELGRCSNINGIDGEFQLLIYCFV